MIAFLLATFLQHGRSKLGAVVIKFHYSSGAGFIGDSIANCAEIAAKA